MAPRAIRGSGTVLVSLAIVTAGCLGPELDRQGAAPATEQDRLTQLLVSRGFSADQIAFHGDQVLVEGDIAFDRQGLLQELGAAEDGVETVEQAAYWFRPADRRGRAPGSVPRATNIRLAFTAEIAPQVQTAVREAAALWTEAAGEGGCIDIDEGNTGRSLFVVVQPLFARDPQTGEQLPVAGRARLPMFQGGAWQVGNVIWIDPGAAIIREPADEDWLKHVAVHELGHILGFPHPQDVGPAHHIAGTRSRGVGARPRTYPTVMDYDGEETGLTPDDVNGVQQVYARDLAGACPADQRR
jgi:hypothetical protein